ETRDIPHLQVKLSIPPWLTYRLKLGVVTDASSSVRYLEPTDGPDFVDEDPGIPPQWIDQEPIYALAPVQPMASLDNINSSPVPIPTRTILNLDLASIYERQLPGILRPQLRVLEFTFTPSTNTADGLQGAVQISGLAIPFGSVETSETAADTAEAVTAVSSLRIDASPLTWKRVHGSGEIATF